ncbi:MAG: RagB/SusD family nutrient uptake outer membrane protein [Alistipes sp.]|nr:RagB/SusD family nutrient uptake outer membrane protein [Alistipes sp.]
MIKILKTVGLSCAVLLLAANCIKEVEPQNNLVSGGQIEQDPAAFSKLVKGIFTPMIANYIVMSEWPWDFAYPSLMLERDFMGQDYVAADNFWQIWYTVHTALGAEYAGCQLPWSFYYQLINNCNTIIGMVPDYASASTPQRHGAGLAYAMRAFAYMDLARMYQYTYKGNEDKPTVPIVTEHTTDVQKANNPRATNEAIWKFILEDLDKAEACLADYRRSVKTEPDINVVYGLKARAFLTIEEFPSAEKYAALAQEGYTPMTRQEWLDKTSGFNNLACNAWLWGMQQSNDDPIIKNYGGLYSWIGSFCVEQSFGYAGMDGGSFPMIDAHLYSTIPDTDFRKQAFLAPEDAGSPEDVAKYTDYRPASALAFSLDELPAYTSFKFRPGNKGYTDYTTGCAVGIPLMRVEEMMLIEAEAIGMQPGREAEGKQKLEAFAALRDPSYTMPALTSFRDNVWWQRRVELWGEGFATFDIKRLNKGIIRSYAGTNHLKSYRFNTDGVPQWMNYVIVGTEFDNNLGLGANNPTPTPPAGGDSPEYEF